MISLIIIILAVLALAILLSPMTVSINSASSGGKLDGSFSFAWIMLMFRYQVTEKETDILFLGRHVVRMQHKEKSLKSKNIKKSGSIKRSKKKMGDIFSLSKPMLQLLKDLIYSFKLKNLNIDITIGFKDPAYTGIITGFLHSIFGSFQAGNTIRWTVDFKKPVLEWNLKAEAAITPIHILLHMTKFLASKQVLKSGFQFIRD